MSAIEPAGEKIVKNLQQAIARLQDDIVRVEMWAGALGCFTKPIPDYGFGQTKFDLPPKTNGNAKASTEASGHRRSASKIGSPSSDSLSGSGPKT